MRYTRIFVLVLLTAMLMPVDVEAQCAMCKAVVESNAQNGDNVVGGVNNAIVYLMGVPYFLFFLIGIVWYRRFWNADRK